jgi:hypothetical protein
MVAMEKLLRLNQYQTDLLSNGCPGEAICSRLDLPATDALVGGRQAYPSDDSIHLPSPTSSLLSNGHKGKEHTHITSHVNVAKTSPTKSLAHFGKQLASRLAASRVHEINSLSRASLHHQSSPGSQCYTGFYYFGCIDSKLTNSSLFWALTTRTQGGPTHDDQVPFQW